MDYRSVSTTCVYCGAGCGLWLEVLDGEIVGVLPDKEHPVSRGMLCIKGWNAASFVNQFAFIRQPAGVHAHLVQGHVRLSRKVNGGRGL